MSHPAHDFAKSVLIYAVATFVAGFAFGILRELVLIPLAGLRTGHWIEFPLMLAATWCAALYAMRVLITPSRMNLLLLGIIGTILLIAIESSFALYVMKLPLHKYLASYDVTDGALFPWGLLFMVLAPLLIGALRSKAE